MTYIVGRTKEWLRIWDLATRALDVTEDQIKAVTQRYVQPGIRFWDDPNTIPPKGFARLKPIQVRGLLDLESTSGCYGGVAAWGVGHGKFLMSTLAFTARSGTQRPMLIVPAKLKHQTGVEMLKQRPTWKIRTDIRVMSWEKLSRQSGLDELTQYCPDGISADEVHALKDPKSARSRKLMRYFKHIRNVSGRDLWFLGLSGTVLNRSVKELGHVAELALLDKTPLPRTYTEVEGWSRALDEKIQDFYRADPGALLDFGDGPLDDPDDSRTAEARRAVRKRMVSTPGFSATSAGSLGVSLNVFEWDYEVSPEVETHYQNLQEDWVTPGGEEIDSALNLWRHSREIMCGFYGVWDPPPPEQWLVARGAWNRFVRESLARSANPRSTGPAMDSPLDVSNAIDRGALPDPTGSLTAWRAVRHSYTVNPKPMWFDTGIVDAAAQWATKNKGIVWCEFKALGAEFEKLGLPYYGAADDRISDAKGPCAASRQAHYEGKNLQQWSKNLILSPPTSGKIWEQLLGRTHRPGQTADDVEVHVFLGCGQLYDGFTQARADCRFQEQLLGSRMKLNDATYVDVTTTQDARQRKGALWD